MNDLESALRARFTVRQEQFVDGRCALTLLLPQSADDLLDEEAFERDERMPYWADLWPSARGLARWLVRQPLRHGRWLELGCGVGLPSLIVKWRGGEVLASDFNVDALLFAQVNALRNGLGKLETTLLDWRDVPPTFGKFEFVLAADVLYEQRNAIALVDLLPRILAPHGRFILADPGRRWLSDFQRRMRNANWNERDLDVMVEPPRGEGAPSTIRVIEFWKREDFPHGRI